MNFRKFDISAIDFHALSQAERSEFYRLAMRHAHEERAQAVLAMLRTLAQRLRNAQLRRRALEVILPARLIRAYNTNALSCPAQAGHPAFAGLAD